MDRCSRCLTTATASVWRPSWVASSARLATRARPRRPAALLPPPPAFPIGGISVTQLTSPPTAQSWTSAAMTIACGAGSRRQREDRFQGLPAHLLARPGERARLGLRFNDMVASGELAGPIVIDATISTRLRRLTVRETEDMKNGSTRSPTGACSTPWSTPAPAPRRLPSTTAAASESAAPFTPGWWSWPTGRARPAEARAGSHDRSGTGVMRHADASYDDARPQRAHTA